MKARAKIAILAKLGRDRWLLIVPIDGMTDGYSIAKGKSIGIATDLKAKGYTVNYTRLSSAQIDGIEKRFNDGRLTA